MALMMVCLEGLKGNKHLFCFSPFQLRKKHLWPPSLMHSIQNGFYNGFNHCFAFSISYIFSPLNWFLIHQASILPKVCTVSNLLCWLVFNFDFGPYFSTVILTFYKQNSAFQNYVSRFSFVYMTFFDSFVKLIFAFRMLN